MLVLVLGVGGLGLSKLGNSTPAEPRASAAPVSAAAATVDTCAALEQRLCREFGETTSACALAGREIAGFSTARCEGMLGRYGQVALELRDLDVGTRELTAPEQVSLHGEAPWLGPRDAELTLVEFADFQASDCARALRPWRAS